MLNRTLELRVKAAPIAIDLRGETRLVVQERAKRRSYEDKENRFGNRRADQ
jgi:hypothetical protein